MSETIQVDRPVHAGMLINGEWTSHNDRIEVRNPARPDEIVGTIGRGTVEHVDAAVAAEIDRLELTPPLRHRLIVAPKGVVGA